MSMNHIPCPGRIITDLGDAFSTGAGAGSIWYFLKGAYYSVRKERFRGGIQLLASRAPILGGNFGMWGCIFAASTCAMTYMRNKEDMLNSVVGGATTGFILSIRAGFRNAIRASIFGALFLGIIEVVMVVYQRQMLRSMIIEENKKVENFKKERQRMTSLMRKKNAGQTDSVAETVNRI